MTMPDSAKSDVSLIPKESPHLYKIQNMVTDFSLIDPIPDSPIPPARSGHSGVYYSGKIYIFGGYNGTTPQNDLWSLKVNPITLEVLGKWEKVTSQNPPPPRSWTSKTLVNGHKWYMFGGEGAGSINFNSFFCLDLESMIWEELFTSSTAPAPRSSCPGVYIPENGNEDPRIIITGGTGKTGLHSDVWSFNLLNFVWTKLDQVGDIPSPYYGHTAILYRNHLVIHGGNRGQRTDQLLTYHIETGHWTSYVTDSDAQSIPSGRDGHSAFLLDNKMMICGGYSGGKAVNEIWFLHLDLLIDHKIVSWTRQASKDDIGHHNFPPLSYAATIPVGRGRFGFNFFTFAGWDATWKTTFYSFSLEPPFTIGSAELVTQLLDKFGPDSSDSFISNSSGSKPLPQQLIKYRAPSMADWFPQWKSNTFQTMFTYPKNPDVELFNHIPIFAGAIYLKKYASKTPEPSAPPSEEEADTSTSNISIYHDNVDQKCSDFLRSFLVADILDESIIPQYDFLTPISLWITANRIFDIPRVAVWAGNRICSSCNSLSKLIASSSLMNLDFFTDQLSLLSEWKSTYDSDYWIAPFQTLSSMMGSHQLLLKPLSQLVQSPSSSDSSGFNSTWGVVKKVPLYDNVKLSILPIPPPNIVFHLENLMKHDVSHSLIAYIRGINLTPLMSQSKDTMIRILYWMYTGDFCKSSDKKTLNLSLMFSVLSILHPMFLHRNLGYLDIATQFAQILVKQSLSTEYLTSKLTSSTSSFIVIPPEVLLKLPSSIQSVYYNLLSFRLSSRVTSLEETVISLQHIIRDQQTLITNLAKRVSKLDPIGKGE